MTIARPPIRGIGCLCTRGRSAVGWSIAPTRRARTMVSGVAASVITAASPRPQSAVPSEARRRSVSQKDMRPIMARCGGGAVGTGI